MANNQQENEEQTLQNPQQYQQSPQKQKKKGGCFSFFMGWTAAFFFLIFCVGGFGAYVYFCVTVEQLAGVIGVKAPLGEFNKKTVNELIKIAIAEKNKYVHITFDKLNEYGIKLPDTVLGVELGNLYEVDVTFNGETKRLGSIEVMDAAYNAEAFVSSVLPAVYKTANVGAVLNALQIDISEIGYPATKDAIYDVDGEKKSLTDMSVAEALDALPKYYGQEHLTLQRIEEALDLKLVPYATEADQTEYGTILSKTISNLTFEDIAENTKIGALLDLLGDNALGLNEYAFAQTEEFKNTKVNKLGEYIKQVKLNEILNIDDITTIENPTSLQRLMYSIRNITIGELIEGGKTKLGTIIDKTTLSYLVSTADNTAIMEVVGQISITDLLMNEQSVATKLIAATNTIDELISPSALSPLYPVKDKTFGYLFENPTDATVEAALNNTKFSDIIKTDQNIMSIIKDITLNQIFFDATQISNTLTASASTMQTVLELTDPATITDPTEMQTDLWTIKDETFQSLVDGYNSLINALSTLTIESLTGINTGIMSIIGSVSLGDIMTDTSCIIDAINNSDTTLGTLFSITETKGIIAIIKNVTVGDLFTDAGSAITNALESSTSTLADLLNMSSATGAVSAITNITVGELFTDPETTLQNTIDNFKLSDVIDASGNKILTAILNQKNNPNFSGYDADPALRQDVTVSTIGEAINLVTLADILDTTPTTGILTLININTPLKDLGDTLTDFDLMNKTLVDLESAEIFGANSPFKDTKYDVDSTVLVDGTHNAYEKYVIDNGSAPDEKLQDFILALSSSVEGASFVEKFINGTLTPV